MKYVLTTLIVATLMIGCTTVNAEEYLTKTTNQSRCYSIDNNDIKQLCLAQVNEDRNRCYNIKDPITKQLCIVQQTQSSGVYASK